MKQYQPKVKQIEQYSDSQGEHIVCRGKLLLLDQPLDLYSIIISEREEIELGDLVYHERMFTTGVTGIYKAVDRRSNGDFKFVFIDDPSIFFYATKSHKILTLPEHFSDKHLQAIVDGKLKDQDKVLIKCTRGDVEREEYFEVDIALNWKVYLNQQNHITLFPAKQSLEDSIKQHINEWKSERDISFLYSSAVTDSEVIEFIKEWAKKNNY